MSTGAQTPKKKPTPKPHTEHPKYIEMIVAAITSLKERNGSSRQAVAKYIMANFKVGENASTHIKHGLKRGVANQHLKQVKGTGASGSFKVDKPLPEKKSVAKKPAPKKKPAVKKPPAKKPKTKKEKPKKKPETKKPSAKKAPKKLSKKKTDSGKKTPKKAAKKPAAKKPAAKKSTSKGKK